MFDIGWSEFLVIIVVILLVVGPKDLPRVVRTFGQWTGKAKSYARDFQRTIEEAADENELAAIRKEIEIANRELAEVKQKNFGIDTKIDVDGGPTDPQAAQFAAGTIASGASIGGTVSAPETGLKPAPSAPSSPLPAEPAPATGQSQAGTV